MRTTLTLDDDLAVALRARAKGTGRAFRHVVNETIREGLARLERGPEDRPPYRMTTSDPGPPALLGVHSVHEMLAHAEGEDYR